MATLLLLTLLLAEEPITEITLERTPCFGSCPVDKIVLRSDGKAVYTGTEAVKKRGVYTGRLSKEDFQVIVSLLEEKKFFDLEDWYTPTVTCGATRITTVKRGKSAKQVRNYSNSAPKSLEVIEEQIIDLMEKMEWTMAK